MKRIFVVVFMLMVYGVWGATYNDRVGYIDNGVDPLTAPSAAVSGHLDVETASATVGVSTPNLNVTSLLRATTTTIANTLTALSGRFNTAGHTTTTLVSFVFDDEFDTQYTNAFPVFQARGVPACIAVATLHVGVAGYMTWEELAIVQAAGWEIMSHSQNHPDLRIQTDANLEMETSGSKVILASHGLIANNFVYPGGLNDERVRRVTRKYYRSGRAISNSFNGPIINTYALNCDLFDPALLSLWESQVDLATTRSLWYIVYVHAVDTTAATALGTFIDYIQAKNIPIVTIAEALNRVGNPVDISSEINLGQRGISILAGQININKAVSYGSAKLHIDNGAIAAGLSHGTTDADWGMMAGKTVYGILGYRNPSGIAGGALGGFGVVSGSGIESPGIWGYNEPGYPNYFWIGSVIAVDRNLATGFTPRMTINLNSGEVQCSTTLRVGGSGKFGGQVSVGGDVLSSGVLRTTWAYLSNGLISSLVQAAAGTGLTLRGEGFTFQNLSNIAATTASATGNWWMNALRMPLVGGANNVEITSAGLISALDADITSIAAGALRSTATATTIGSNVLIEGDLAVHGNVYITTGGFVSLLWVQVTDYIQCLGTVWAQTINTTGTIYALKGMFSTMYAADLQTSFGSYVRHDVLNASSPLYGAAHGTSPTVGQVPKWTGVAWEPAADAGGGGSGQEFWKWLAEGFDIDTSPTGATGPVNWRFATAAYPTTVTIYGDLIVTDTVTAAYFVGDGSGLTGVSGIGGQAFWVWTTTDKDVGTSPVGAATPENFVMAEAANETTNTIHGVLIVSKSDMVTTSKDGVVAKCEDDTDSVVIVRMSPRVRLTGSGWDTDSNVPREASWWWEVLPANGATITSTFYLKSSIAGASTQTQLTINEFTQLVTAEKFKGDLATQHYTLPHADGTAGQILGTNGSGTVSFGTTIGATTATVLTANGRLTMTGVIAHGSFNTTRASSTTINWANGDETSITLRNGTGDTKTDIMMRNMYPGQECTLYVIQDTTGTCLAYFNDTGSGGTLISGQQQVIAAGGVFNPTWTATASAVDVARFKGMGNGQVLMFGVLFDAK